MTRPATTSALKIGCFTHRGTSDPRSPRSPISFRFAARECECVCDREKDQVMYEARLTMKGPPQYDRVVVG